MKGMSKHVTEDFFFNSQLRGKLNFDEYCAHEGAISYNCSIETLDIVESDTGHEAHVIHHILDNEADFYADLPVTLYFDVRNGIIHNIASKYKTTAEVQHYIENVFKPIYK